MRLTRKEKRLLHSGRKILAIKSIFDRMATGERSLRGAKELADKYQRTLGYRWGVRRAERRARRVNINKPACPYCGGTGRA